jgi:hypothetical protein
MLAVRDLVACCRKDGITALYVRIHMTYSVGTKVPSPDTQSALSAASKI